MQLVINIEKKHFIILVALISLLGIFIIGSAEDVSQDLPYHYLQQVSKSNSDMTSVDENKDKVIDEAENLTASGDSHVLNNLIMHAALDMNGNNINNIGKIGDVDSADMVSNLNADMVDGVQASGLTPPTCTGENKALQYDGSNWLCKDISSGSSVNYLVNSAHTEGACLTEGGEVVSDGSGNEFCRFSSSSCPAGWAQYKHWSTTQDNCCSGSSFADCPCKGSNYCCNVYGHSWSNQAQETCTYSRMGPGDSTCYASINKIGCY